MTRPLVSYTSFRAASELRGNAASEPSAQIGFFPYSCRSKSVARECVSRSRTVLKFRTQKTQFAYGIVRTLLRQGYLEAARAVFFPSAIGISCGYHSGGAFIGSPSDNERGYSREEVIRI